MSDYFWQHKSLHEMSRDEWESVCDGCAKCCLQQLQDEETEELVFTDVACDLLQAESCRCSDYPNRSKLVPNCMTMTADNVEDCVAFAPSSCAYRLLLQGEDLPSWHHLRSGSDATIHNTGNSVRGRIQFCRDVATEDLENHIVDWP